MANTRDYVRQTPAEIAEAILVRYQGVVAAAALSVARGSNTDRERMVDEVQSDLAHAAMAGKFEAFDPAKASFETYLAAAARNAARDFLRSDKREASLDVAGETTESVEEDVSREDREARIEALRDALHELEEADPLGSAVLRARYIDGLTYRKIAERLGVRRVSRLHMRAHRAVARLAKMMKANGVEYPTCAGPAKRPKGAFVNRTPV